MGKPIRSNCTEVLKLLCNFIEIALRHGCFPEADIWMTASGLYKKGLIISASLTFTFTLIMLIYSDLVWESTQSNFLRDIYSHQNHALALLHNKNRFYDFKELFESCETLSIYKLNLLKTPVFMHKIKNRTAPS